MTFGPGKNFFLDKNIKTQTLKAKIEKKMGLFKSSVLQSK
jgi:hypothetical protein